MLHLGLPSCWLSRGYRNCLSSPRNFIGIAPPPFAMRVCDLTNEDLAPEDIWASMDDGNVLGHLQWLTSLACDRDDLQLRAETAAGYFLDIACAAMPALLPGD